MEIKYDVNSCKMIIEDYERVNWKDGSEMLDEAVYNHGREDVSEVLTNWDENELFELQRQFWGDMNFEEFFVQLEELSYTCYKNPKKGVAMIRKAEKLYELLGEYLNHILGELIEEKLSKLKK